MRIVHDRRVDVAANKFGASSLQFLEIAAKTARIVGNATATPGAEIEDAIAGSQQCVNPGEEFDRAVSM